jgi:hypothetical protein
MVHMEMQDGALQPWDEFIAAFCVSDLRGFSPFLHIYAPTMRLLFESVPLRTLGSQPTDSPQNLRSYNAYPDRGFGQVFDVRDKTPLLLTRAVEPGDRVERSMLNGECESILIRVEEHTIRSSRITFMVVCWLDGVAERIGLISLEGARFDTSHHELSGDENYDRTAITMNDARPPLQVLWKTIKLG